MALKSTMSGLEKALAANQRYRAALEDLVRLTHNERSLIARQVNSVALAALQNDKAISTLEETKP